MILEFVEKILSYMNRLIDGKPGLLVDKRCQRLRKALSGGYHFKKYRSLVVKDIEIFQTRMNTRMSVMRLCIYYLVVENIKD